MLRSFRLRLATVVLIVGFTMTAGSTQATASNIMSTGEEAAILVGTGVVIGLVVFVVYKAVPKQKTITGCVEMADNALKLKDAKDKRIYVLESEILKIKAGQHLKVKGKKSKDKSGTLMLEVRKIVSDFGPCTQTPIS